MMSFPKSSERYLSATAKPTPVEDLGGGFPSESDRDTDVTVQGYEGASLEEFAAAIATTLERELTAPIRAMLDKTLGIHKDAKLPPYTSKPARQTHGALIYDPQKAADKAIENQAANATCCIALTNCSQDSEIRY